MGVVFLADAVVPVDEVRLAVEVPRKKDVAVDREAPAVVAVVVNRDVLVVGLRREQEGSVVRRVVAANVVLRRGGARPVVDVNN